LVVDDSEDQLESLQMVLQDAGFEVITAANGAEGLRLVQELHPDVILLDMMMPEMDGLTFLSRLAAHHSPPPVIANSGFPAFRAEALRRGAWSFLRKPVSLNTLLAALRAALERRPVPPSVVAENEASVATARRAAEHETADAISRLDRRGISAAREPLQRTASWVAAYFGYGQCLVNLLRGTEFWVEAVGASASASTRFRAGERTQREDFLCDDVVTAGSTLVLTDPVNHPCEHFARQKVLQYGVRFYVGVPLTAPSGAVLGTLCVMDGRPHEFCSEDMRVLEALGLAAARGLETGEWPLDEQGAFGRAYLDLFIDVAATRATREAGAGVAVTVEWSDRGAELPRAKGLSVVRFDDRVVLLWAGPAGAWSPPEDIARRALAIVEFGGPQDREAARQRLLAISGGTAA
jgi:CheY-like chemotaxis protein